MGYGDQTEWVEKAEIQIAKIFCCMKEYKQSYDHLKALEKKMSGDSKNYGNFCDTLAIICGKLKYQELAVFYLEKELDWNAKRHGKDPYKSRMLDRARILYTISLMRLTEKDVDKATEALSECVEIREKLLGSVDEETLKG